MLKQIIRILSLYIFVLTVIPCIDDQKDNTMSTIELSHNTTNNHPNDSDHCSPFCICSCCASHIIFQINIIQIYSFSTSLEFDLGDYNGYASALSGSIWQPPKIS